MTLLVNQKHNQSWLWSANQLNCRHYVQDVNNIQKPLVDGDISNSSLRDVDKAALEDELTAYMNELARRQLS